MMRVLQSCRMGLLRLATLAALVISGSAAVAQEPPLHLRIVGGLAGMNQYTRHEAPFWTQRLRELSGGRITAEIVPNDQAGIRGQEMHRLMQLGAVPFGTALLSRIALSDPELHAVDLAAMNPDVASLRRAVAAFRPHLERALRERHGIELLAIYVYPAQSLFCARPFGTLADLAGRRVRVSNASQADLMRALGALPTSTEFAETVAALRSGNVECAITGTMSGFQIGLHEVTSHVHAAPITWGLSLFGANAAAWAALPESARALLQRELPRLEQAVWGEADTETRDGLACNTGAASCPQRGGRPGRMVEVRTSATEQAQLRALFANAVLPRWLERCGKGCAELWNRELMPVTGISASPRP